MHVTGAVGQREGSECPERQRCSRQELEKRKGTKKERKLHNPVLSEGEGRIEQPQG